MDENICLAEYRYFDGGRPTAVFCTFEKGHADPDDVTPHSWQWLARKQEACLPNAFRPDVDVLIENIASGSCDAYLEAILAAAHGRKRALRNVTRPYGRS